MAFSTITSDYIQLFAEAMSDNLPIVKATASNMVGKLENKRAGQTAKIVIRDAGTVGSGLDATSWDRSNREYERTATIENKGIAVDVDTLAKVTDVVSFDSEIIEKRVGNLCNEIQKDISAKSCFTSGVVLVNAASAPVSLDDLSTLSGKLGLSEAQGEFVGFMGSMEQSSASSGALSKFIPDPVMKEIYGRSNIGDFANVAWNRVNLPTVTIGASNALIAAASTKIASDQVSGETLDLIDANWTAGLVLPRGTPFTVASVNGATIFGGDTGMSRVFITEADATCTLGACSVKVQYCGLGGGKNYNATGNKLAANAVCTPLLTAGKTYRLVWAFERGNVEYDYIKQAAMPGAESLSAKSADSKIVLDYIAGGDVLTRVGTHRIDNSYLAVGVDPCRSGLIYQATT